MFFLRRSVTVSFAFTLLLWSCQASGQRIRRRASSVLELPVDKISQQGFDGDSAHDDESHRLLSSNSNSTSCAAIDVDGIAPCASYCAGATGSSLNTFIEMERGSGEKQYCCACFSGDAFCSDDIPECQDYVNLDVGGLSIKWNQSQQDTNSSKVPAEADVQEDMSCMDLNVTDTLSCIDFCEELTGDTAHEFGSHFEVEKYFCVCSSTIIGGGTAEYCSDGMPDTWKEALANSTILPIGSRLGLLP